MPKHGRTHRTALLLWVVALLAGLKGAWVSLSVCLVFFLSFWNARAENAVGVRGHVGCRENARRVNRLQITKPGVYDNYLVDSEWAGGNRVKITADNVTLRNCEIRNLKIRNLAFGDGVERKYHMVGRGPFPGYDNRGESEAESFETILKHGWK